MNEINSGCYHNTGTTVGYGLTSTTLGYSQTINGGTGGFFTPGVSVYDSSPNYPLSQAITNTNNMSKQVKVAVFTVKRNDKNEIISSAFNKEFWVEQKNGGSIDLLVAKQLDKDFDPETTVIKVLSTVQF